MNVVTCVRFAASLRSAQRTDRSLGRANVPLIKRSSLLSGSFALVVGGTTCNEPELEDMRAATGSHTQLAGCGGASRPSAALARHGGAGQAVRRVQVVTGPADC